MKGGVIKATVSDHITQQCHAQLSTTSCQSRVFLSPLLSPVLDGTLFLYQSWSTATQHQNERDFLFVTSLNCNCSH